MSLRPLEEQKTCSYLRRRRFSAINAARLDRRHHAALRGREGWPRRLTIGVTVAAEEVRPLQPRTIHGGSSAGRRAEAFWSRTAYGRLDSETFVVSGPEGRNLPLAAIA